MNLVVDIGNSYVKLAVFNDCEIINRQRVSNVDALKVFKKLLKNFKALDSAIISSVGKLNKKQFEYLDKHLEVLQLNSKTKLPFKNLYETPTTLGVDRIALVCAAVQQYKNKDVLIIDAGTCITYDFINREKEYLGGAISPGLRTRYKSLNNLTSNLPLLETEVPKDIIGKSTDDAIHSGIFYGIINEIDGVIDTYLEKYSDLTVILTGGDVNFLSKQLKSSIFANSNFLLEGLNYILQFNSN